LRFAGQYFDAETGLHYNLWRHYDPKTGKYLRTDPIGLRDNINLYIYSQSNPINLVDPFGLFCQIEHSDPVAGGDPISFRHKEVKEGYSQAVAEKLAWELAQVALKLPPLPSPNFEYTLRKTTYGTYYLYVQYVEVCYDDCTKEEISRTLLEKGRINRTTEIVEEETVERMYL
jgi:RHS repeat-associated protein